MSKFIEFSEQLLNTRYITEIMTEEFARGFREGRPNIYAVLVIRKDKMGIFAEEFSTKKEREDRYSELKKLLVEDYKL